MKDFVLIPIEKIESRILFLRGKKVMLDVDLAELYKVKTKVLNQAVKRNLKRFPIDFMFQLTKNEMDELVTNCDRFKNLKHSTSYSFAFTEQGVAMLSSILNSERAILVNIQIIRTFTKLRELLATNTKLRIKIEKMEKKYNYQLKEVFEILKQLLKKEKPKEEKPKTQIGFRPK